MNHPQPLPAGDGLANRAPLVLVAEDDRAMRMVLEHQLASFGYEVISASDGTQALQMILQEGRKLDAIVLDREMPGLTGIEVVKKIKEQPGLGAIPVVMQTSAGSPEQVQDGIEAGVFYYLVKPVDKALLHSVITAAFRESQLKRTLSSELLRQRHAFGMMDTGLFRLHTLSEAEDLASFLANCYPDPDRVIGGMAELLINAVEHGNLAISYDEKTQLLAQNRWREEVERRANLPEYHARRAEVTFKRKSDGLYVQITDEGAGFDWAQYMRVSPSRASDSHGRGIAQANLLSFDKLIYNPVGNQVMGVVYLTGEEGSKG